MTNDTLVEYFKSLGWKVEAIRGQDSMDYAVIRDYHINVGSLAGKICDVAILRNNSIYSTACNSHKACSGANGHENL